MPNEYKEKLSNIIHLPPEWSYEKDNWLMTIKTPLLASDWLNRHDYELIGVSKEWAKKVSMSGNYKLLILKNVCDNTYRCMHIDIFMYMTLLKNWAGVELTQPEWEKFTIKFYEG